MLTALQAKGEAIAAAARVTSLDRLAARVRGALPGVAVSIEEDGIVLTGRGLTRRLVEDAQLRWIGSLWR